MSRAHLSDPYQPSIDAVWIASGDISLAFEIDHERAISFWRGVVAGQIGLLREEIALHGLWKGCGYDDADADNERLRLVSELRETQGWLK